MALGVALGAATALASPLASAGALLGLAGALLIIRAPEVGLVALVSLIYLLPFAVIPVRIGVQLTALEAILGLTFAAVLLRLLVKRETVRPTAEVLLFLGILSLAGLSFLLSLPFTGDITEVGRKVAKLFLAMMAFPVTLHLIRSRNQVESLTKSIIILTAAQATVAVMLYLAPRDFVVRLLSGLGPLGYPTGEGILRFLPGENDTYTEVLRATGTSIDPNVLGGALMLGAALALTQLFAPRPLLPRWVLTPIAIVTVLAMLQSHSRGSWVGLTVGLLAVATVRYRRLWFALLPAGTVVALLPAGRALYERVLSGFAGQDKAAGMRLDEYRNALEIVQHHPIFGIGFGNAPTIDLAPGVSSLYLTIAETAGIPALIGYLALIGWLLTATVRSLLDRLEPGIQGVIAGHGAAFVAGLTAGLFDHYFASTAFPHTVALFWLINGLLLRSLRLVAGPFSWAERYDGEGEHALVSVRTSPPDE